MMTTVTKVTDLQLVLLSAASQRRDGSLLPPPETLRSARGLSKAIAALLKRGLIVEVDAADPAQAWRVEGTRHIGVIITDEGRAAIGIEAAAAPAAVEEVSASAAPKQDSKAALVLDLLAREQGATLDELVAATGWLPHSTRAALTGLRKKGKSIDRRKRGELSCYHMVAAA